MAEEGGSGMVTPDTGNLFPRRPLDEAAAQGVRLSGVLLTHTHADHMGGVLRRRSLPGVGELCEEMRPADIRSPPRSGPARRSGWS